MKHGDYIIIRLVKEDMEDTQFFLPGDTWAYRTLTIARMKKDGWQVLAEAHVDREAYFNERVNVRVKDYSYSDNLEQDIKKKFRSGEISREVFWNTMRMIQDNKWVSLCQIDSLIGRMCRLDMDVHNEIAIELVNQYRQAVLPV